MLQPRDWLDDDSVDETEKEVGWEVVWPMLYYSRASREAVLSFYKKRNDFQACSEEERAVARGEIDGVRGRADLIIYRLDSEIHYKLKGRRKVVELLTDVELVRGYRKRPKVTFLPISSPAPCASA